MNEGVVVNRTGESILVYGPKVAGETKDNSLWLLRAGESTPEDDWDCDGFYVPSDRKVNQLVFPDKAGPVAVKVMGYQTMVVSLLNEVEYDCDTNNWGVFAADEMCQPGGEICWHVPNVKHNETSGYPPVHPEPS